MSEETEQHLAPEWLGTRLERKFIDASGKLTWENSPDEMRDPNNLVLFHVLLAFGQQDIIQTLDDYNLFVKHLLPKCNERLNEALNSFCLESHEEFIKLKETLCPICHKNPITDDILIACKQCKRQNVGYTQHVRIHLYRARQARTPATLTLPEWLATLQRFNYHCAYCLEGDYEVLEHYIPISQGGGTTQENCVPACHKCNRQKSSRHPELAIKREEMLIKVGSSPDNEA